MTTTQSRVPPTSADAWKRDEPETVELPSGNVAVLQRPRIMSMIKRGEVPNPLLEAAVEMATGAKSSDFAKTIEMMDVLVASAFLEPRVTLERDDDPATLWVDDLDDEDKQLVMSWIQSPARAAATFREDGSGDGGGADGAEVRDAAELAVGDPG